MRRPLIGGSEMDKPERHIAEVADQLEDRAAELALSLVRIPSVNPPGSEGEVAGFLADHFRSLKLTTTLQEVLPGRPNVLGILEGPASGPTILLNGHLDTVSVGSGWTQDPSGSLVGDRLYGRGSVDMKGPLAAMVTAVETLKVSGLQLSGTVVIAAVADEEEAQRGTIHLLESGVGADCAIVGEPTQMVPVICHKGVVYFEITTKGVSGHASDPSRGKNAIMAMNTILSHLPALAVDLKGRSHPMVGSPTLSVGTIHGGSGTCIIPDCCTITVDRRVVPGEKLETVVSETEAFIRRIAEEHPEVDVAVSAPVLAEPMQISENEPVVRALRGVYQDYLGVDPGVIGWAAVSDANRLVNKGGIPTVICGPGDLRHAHKPDESIELKDLTSAVKLYAIALWRLLTQAA